MSTIQKTDQFDKYEKLVFKVYHDIKPNIQPNDYQDLIQEGRLGLWKAIQSYDPDRGFAFSTFAYRNIKNSMVDFLRKNQKNMNIDYFDILPISKKNKSFNILSTFVLLSALETALKTTPQKIGLKALMLKNEGYTLKEIAVILDYPLQTLKTYVCKCKKELRDNYKISDFLN